MVWYYALINQVRLLQLPISPTVLSICTNHLRSWSSKWSHANYNVEFKRGRPTTPNRKLLKIMVKEQHWHVSGTQLNISTRLCLLRLSRSSVLPHWSVTFQIVAKTIWNKTCQLHCGCPLFRESHITVPWVSVNIMFVICIDCEPSK